MARHRLTAFRESRSVASLDRLDIDTHDLQVVLEKTNDPREKIYDDE